MENIYIREKVLKDATSIIMNDRNNVYGPPEVSFNSIAKFWNCWMVCTHRDVTFDEEDVAIMLLLMKIARTSFSNKYDNFVDMAGYAACAAEVVMPNDG